MNLKIIRLTGDNIKPYIPALAELRINVFRDYPYLYDGDMAYEQKYLHTYIDRPHATMVIALDDDHIVGAATAIPLRDETTYCQAPFIAAGMDISSIFYFGESVLLHAYRGQQTGKRFFAEREAAAREAQCTIAAFCSVERAANDPRRPVNWHPLDRFWEKLGYRKHPELLAYFSWKELGETSESDKPMTFWIKQL